MPAFEHTASRLLDLKNRVDFSMRRFFRWSRPVPLPGAEPPVDLFAHLPPAAAARANNRSRTLEQTYHLNELPAVLTADQRRENLFYLDFLEQALESSGVSLPAVVRAADAGPSHWFYVQALFSLLRWWRSPSCRSVSLDGYEVDAYRVYADLHSRRDHALANLSRLPGVTYHDRAFSPLPGALSLVTLLFPFVFIKDHLEWGLPAPLFHPETLLEHAWQSLQPGGVLIIANQGLAEHEAQQALLTRCGIPITAAFRVDPLLYVYDLDRFVLVAARER